MIMSVSLALMELLVLNRTLVNLLVILILSYNIKWGGEANHRVRGLTAMFIHYSSQYLPTPLALHGALLPAWQPKLIIFSIFLSFYWHFILIWELQLLIIYVYIELRRLTPANLYWGKVPLLYNPSWVPRWQLNTLMQREKVCCFCQRSRSRP